MAAPTLLLSFLNNGAKTCIVHYFSHLLDINVIPLKHSTQKHSTLNGSGTMNTLHSLPP